MNPEEKHGGPLGRAEERRRPGGKGAPPPHTPAPLLFHGQFGLGWGGREEGCVGRIGLNPDPARRCWWKRRA